MAWMPGQAQFKVHIENTIPALSGQPAECGDCYFIIEKNPAWPFNAEGSVSIIRASFDGYVFLTKNMFLDFPKKIREKKKSSI